MEKYLDSSFEKKGIKIALSEYYIEIVNDMVGQLLYSEPGKRMWIDNLGQDNNGWFYDYRITKRSTFPDWSKFFFEKSIYSKNINKGQILENGKILVEKKYNGNKKEFINILKKSLIKGLTERQGNALEKAFSNFNDYIYENEYKYGKNCFNNNNVKEGSLLYDSEGNLLEN